MESVLSGFVRALRAAGAPASTAEAIDAARAVALVGYADRALLKDSLAVSLAKTAHDKAIHDKVFELYFASTTAVSSAAKTAGDSDGAEPSDQPRDKRTGDQSIDALLDMAQAQNQGPHSPQGSAARRSLARAARAVGTDDIRFASQVSYFTRQMLDELGLGALEQRQIGRAHV